MKNLINEKDNEIKEIESKINKQDNILKNQENNINKLKLKIEGLTKQLNESNNNSNQINYNLYNINNSIKKQIDYISYIKENNETKDIIINTIDNISSKLNNNYNKIISNKNKDFFNIILFEINHNFNDLLLNEKINKFSWLNLVLSEIPKNILIISTRIFFIFFNKLYSNINIISDKLKKELSYILKDLYLELIKYTLTGEINNLLSEDINSSNKNIIKFIKSPNEFILKKINENNNINQSEEISKNNKIEIHKFLNLIIICLYYWKKNLQS